MCPALSSATGNCSFTVGFSLVSQNCRSFTYQLADLSDKVTFAFRRCWSTRGGAGAVKVSAGPALVPGARGSRWPPEGSREAGGEASEGHAGLGSALPRWPGPAVLRSAPAAWVLCLQGSEHGCCLSLPAATRFSQAESKTWGKPTSVFIFFSS